MSRKMPAVSGVTGRTQSDGKYCFVDAHGDIDIFSEIGWSNVKVVNVPQSGQRELTGLNLNCLLRGLFILYGFEDLNDSVLPGGFYCWEVLLESFFISITHFSTIDEILRRIQHLVFVFIHDNDHSGSVEGDNHAVGNVLYGAFSFLMFWILSFSSYLSDSDLTRLRAGIHGLGNQFNEPREEQKKNRYSYNYPQVLEKCRERYAELQRITHEVVQNRLFKTIGLTRNTAPGGNVSIVHNHFAQPNVTQSVGTWAGYEVALNKEKLKTTLASAPQVKLEIFGAENLLDASDDDDEDAFVGRRSGGGSGWGLDAPSAVPPPTVRVAPGTSLLREPYALSIDLFSIDPLELARQWTLADHALFCSIPLHSLMPPPGDNNSTSCLARSQQTRLGLLGRGTFGGALALADRFTAMSTWVTQSILSNASLDARTTRLTYFIRLGAHMAELSNFNALMSILTALMQVCITRLQLTFDGVPKADKVKLAQLKNMMALPKNYQKYRLEVAKLSVHFDFADDMSTFARSDTGRASPRSRSGELVWKRDIIMRYKPDHNSRHGASPKRAAPASAAHALMRSNSMNNLMTKSISLDNPDTIWSENFEAIVPYLGAHSAELTTISEGNGDYLTDRPYLFNTHKMALLAGTLSLLLKMQRLQYNLTPVRNIVAALHFAAKPHLRLSAAAYAENSKKLHALSMAVEPTGMAADYEGSRSSMSSAGGGGGGASRSGGGPVLAPGNPSGRLKFRQSGAYDRLTGKLTTDSGRQEQGEEDSGEGTEEEESEEEDEGETRPRKRSLMSKPFKLVRTLTKAFMTSTSGKH